MRRWLVRIALGLAGLLVLGAAALWFARVPILTRIATSALEAQGFGPVRMTVESVGLGSLHLRSLALRGEAVDAGEIVASFDLLDLLEGHVQQVEIRGLSATVSLGEAGIELDGRPLASGTASAVPSAASPLAGLKVDGFILTDARLSLLRPDAEPMEAVVSASLTLADGVVRGSAFTADIALTVGGERQAALVAAEQVDVELRPGGGGRLTLAKGAVTPKELPWALQEIGAELIWQGETAHLQLTGARLVNIQQPALVVPLQLSGQADLAGAKLDFALRVENPEGGLTLDLKGQHDQSAGAGSATVALAPVVFRRGGRQPGGLAPALAAGLPPLDGSVAVDGSVRWAKAAISPSPTLRLKALAFEMDGTRVRDLTGNLRFTSLLPPVTAPDQVVSATVESAGETLKLKLTGQLTAKPALKLAQASLGAAGGTITTSPLTVENGRSRIETVLTVDGVELAEITRIIGLSGLSGTGKLDGTIPVSFADGKVAIAGGRLAARGPGLLSYRPDNLPPQIAAAGDAVDLTLRVLSGFHYEKLSLDLDKAATGEGTVLLALSGRNPDVAADQPYNFNIRIDSNFDRLVQYALLSLTSAQELLDRAARSVGR